MSAKGEGTRGEAWDLDSVGGGIRHVPGWNGGPNRDSGVGEGGDSRGLPGFANSAPTKLSR